MSEYEEQEDEDHEEDDRRPIPKPRNYAITMKAVNPKEREVYNYYGFLGMNPSFVMVQADDGAMLYACEWSSVWNVRVIPEATVLSVVTH